MRLTRFIGGGLQVRLLTLLSLVAVLAIVASACGDDDDDGDDATTEETEDTATEAEGDGDETATEAEGDGDGDGAGGGEEIRIAEGEPIIIGFSGALTGAAAALGIDSRDGTITGLEIWKSENSEQIGGHEIEIQGEDDGCSDAAIATAAAERLVDIPNLVAITGPMCSGGAQATIPLYSDEGVVMITGSATASALAEEQPQPGFFFRTVFRNADEGVVQANYAVEQGAETAFVIDDTEPYGEDLANAAQDSLEEQGVTVTREQVAVGDTDFSSIASRIADDNPDVVVFEGFNPEGQLLLTAMRGAGYEGLFMSGDGVASVSDFIEPDPELAEGAIFAGCAGELPDDFLALYEETIGNAPSTPFAGQYADAAVILLNAINEVAVEDGGELVINRLELRAAVAAQSIDGVTGPISFSETGDRAGDEAGTLGVPLCEVQDGEFVIIG